MARQRSVNHADPGFSRLLAALDPDGETAGEAYEHLRRALIRFFEWRNIHPADECADITIERLQRKLADDTPIRDIHAFAYGAARLVMLERLRRPIVVPLEQAVDLATPAGGIDGGGNAWDGRQECFEACLARLSEHDHTLVLGYYEHDGRTRIDARRALAGRLGVSENALRIRVQRLRDRLARCHGDCLSGLA